MTSRRSSRLQKIDGVKDQTDGDCQSVEKSHSSRQNSRNYPTEDLLRATKKAEAEDSKNGVPFNHEVSNSPSQTNEASRKEPCLSVLSGFRKMSATGPLMASATSQCLEYPPAPMEGRPHNFGVVIPGVYRSSYPKAEDYGFLQGLKLKTIVTLVKRDETDHELNSFVASSDIRQIVFNMKGTKKAPIPSSTMSSILHVILDQRNYPLLLHCNHGKHRTGCVVAAVRKISGWDLDKVIDEYKTYATPKVRECDIDYITSFQMSPLESPSIRTFSTGSSRFTFLQIRSFLRTLLFSTLVMTIWLVSGSRIVTSNQLPN